ncbi:MAG TPA: GFA family protein [Xanthobacteraceae bacterium]|nr:GFA family protein [Xanthobacteraceae bacterium]
MATDGIEAHEGGCACGAVRFRTVGRPLRVGLCHCLDCRKAHAAPFATFVVFAAEAVSFADADGRPQAVGGDGCWDNGRGYRRYFCRTCGTRICSPDPVTSEIELHLGLFDEPNLWTPTYELWVRRREHWLGTLEGDPERFDEDRP